MAEHCLEDIWWALERLGYIPPDGKLMSYSLQTAKRRIREQGIFAVSANILKIVRKEWENSRYKHFQDPVILHLLELLPLYLDLLEVAIPEVLQRIESTESLSVVRKEARELREKVERKPDKEGWAPLV